MAEFDLRAVVFCPLFPPAYLGGGPIRTLAALVRNAPVDVDTSVITASVDLGQSEPLDVTVDRWVDLSPTSRVRYVNWRSIKAIWGAVSEVRSIRPDFVYLNGFFSARSTILPQILIRLRVLPKTQIVLAPRGEFGGAAISMKSRKKRLYLGAYRRFGLARNLLWHASSAAEAANIEQVIGSNSRIVVRENDTELPTNARLPTKRVGGPLRAVHFARLSPIKGLDLLLASMGALTGELSLDVYGPEEDDDYVARCKKLARDLPDHVRVAFHGPIPHDSVPDVLARYDVMFFPTRGENFSHVIAESLSVSCPVITPDTTPWTDVLRSGGGNVVDSNDRGGWSRAVQAYVNLGEDGWSLNRQKAAGAYARWSQHAAEQPHLFSLIRTDMQRGKSG